MSFWEAIGNFASITGAVGAFWAAIGVFRLRRSQARQIEQVEVSLQLTNENRTVPLPQVLLRRDVRRAEILGLIGMLPMRQPGVRFSIAALATPKFLEDVGQVIEGQSSTLMIPITKKELDQFNLDNYSPPPSR